jgi:hypothetical protein
MVVLGVEMVYVSFGLISLTAHISAYWEIWVVVVVVVVGNLVITKQ